MENQYYLSDKLLKVYNIKKEENEKSLSEENKNNLSYRNAFLLFEKYFNKKDKFVLKDNFNEHNSNKFLKQMEKGLKEIILNDEIIELVICHESEILLKGKKKMSINQEYNKSSFVNNKDIKISIGDGDVNDFSFRKKY